MRRHVNIRLTAILLASLGILAVAVHLVHGYQVKRNAATFQEQANRAEEAGDSDQVLLYLARYLGFAPKDTAALARYGLLLDTVGTKKAKPGFRLQAFLVFHQVLRQDPTQEKVRRQLVRLALDMGRSVDAREHLKILLEASPNDPELLAQRGECEEMAGKYQDAADWYAKACNKAPATLSNYVRLAALYGQRLDRPNDADTAMNDMVAHNGQSAQALTFRARYYLDSVQRNLATARNHGARVQEAAKDVAAARKLGHGDDADVFLTAARVAEAQNDHGAARSWLEQGVRAHPKNAALYVALVNLEIKDNELSQARSWAERGLKSLPKQAELLYSLAEVELRSGKLDHVTELVKQLEKANAPRTGVELLKAMVLVAQGRWGVAADQLEGLRTQFNGNPEQTSRLNLLLAQCHEHLGNPDQALLAYRRAVSLNSLTIAGRLGVAAMLARLGRYAEAIVEYRQLVGLSGVPAEVQLRLCRVLVAQTLQRSPTQRHWEVVKEQLQQAARQLPDSPDVALLQAEVLLQENPKQLGTARQLLEAARDRHPEEASLWVGLADITLAMGKPDEAMRILDQAQGDGRIKAAAPIEVARIQHLVREQAKVALPALREVEKRVPLMPAESRSALREVLATAYERLGQPAEARRLWMQLATQLPYSLPVRLHLFDLAKQAGDEKAARGALSDLRSIEGEQGSLWRYAEAGLLVQDASRQGANRSEVDTKLAEARNLLTAAARARPSWERIPVLQGDLEVLAGRKEQAIVHFQEALRLGDRRPEVVRQLVHLLLASQRFTEADQAVHKLLDNQKLLVAAGLGKMAAESMLRARNEKGAMELATRSVSADSKNYLDQLWRSNLLWAAKKHDEAKQAILAASRLAPDKPEPWTALVTYYVRTGQKKEAQAAIDQARQKLPANQAPLVLAFGYEAVGNLPEAEKQYEAAQSVKPDDVGTRLAAAGFYLRTNQPTKAEAQLDHVLDQADGKVNDSQLVLARRELALALASTTDDAKFQKALRLIEQNIQRDAQSDADRRIEARLLATRLVSRKRAIGMFEDLKRRGPLTADEQYLLAQLYDADKDWAKTQMTLVTLLASEEGRKPAYERYYARHLLAHNDLAGASTWIAEVEKAEPRAPVTVELKAQLLAAESKHDEAINTLTALAQRTDIDLGGLALILESLGQQYPSVATYRTAARDLYGKYVAQDRTPQRLLSLATFLARQGDLDGALVRCQQAMHLGPPEPALVIAEAALRKANGKGEPERRVESWLLDGLKKKPGSVALLMALADLRDYQGRYSEACDCYRRALLAPRPPLVALNNLAWLLAYEPQGTEEALKIINQAIKMVGETPELRDTRATIYLRRGEVGKAIEDLKAALAVVPSPTSYFHLAEAYRLNKNAQAADENLRLARDAGLKPEQLHPLERTTYQEMSSSTPAAK